mmetsp:Transcript_27329/g.57241  ORF Transcript_27329/g.57241 Transcript_27329/m.57241 type:complete len:334 (-) Transcript_27329:100-1101(-)|eukprot:CAMPEP_0172447978 /NCGR_PEP_ID=MMETSP1065-20121228/7093_1 /TAXON_ID=265537 /ORGANISM="Amphiprora paludosa, Strain CCMP125" /LENGTH=333 /DNA_ID=CAMNT_0013199351 /DNA_START=27 /DNA_END=1028 /DNA_ORIENTATION=-
MSSTTKNDAAAKKQRKPRFKKVEHDYPVEPRVIQVVKKPKTYVDHSYRDFSQVPPDMKYQPPTSIEQMSFSEKVYDILCDDSYSQCIQWLPHGRGFKITIPKRLEQSRVLQKYFAHNRFSSFLRQLNNHGFKHVTRGVDRNSYYHECFLRGMKHLLKYMPAGRDARRLMPDPDNEPDLYAISRVCPLPEQQAPVGDQASMPAAGLAQQLQMQNLVSQDRLPLGISLQGLQTNDSLQQAASLQQQASALEHQAAALQRAASLQKAASLQTQMAAMGNDSMRAPMLNTSNNGFQVGGFNSNMNQQNLGNQQVSNQAQLSEDPAMLALLLRSRGMM